jgi:hypothetical protein
MSGEILLVQLQVTIIDISVLRGTVRLGAAPLSAFSNAQMAWTIVPPEQCFRGVALSAEMKPWVN